MKLTCSISFNLSKLCLSVSLSVCLSVSTPICMSLSMNDMSKRITNFGSMMPFRHPSVTMILGSQSQRSRSYGYKVGLCCLSACLQCVVHFIATSVCMDSTVKYRYRLPTKSAVVSERRRNCDQRIAGPHFSTATLDKSFTHTHMPLSPSSITWYRPKCGDAEWLGSQPCMSCGYCSSH